MEAIFIFNVTFQFYIVQFRCLRKLAAQLALVFSKAPKLIDMKIVQLHLHYLTNSLFSTQFPIYMAILDNVTLRAE